MADDSMLVIVKQLGERGVQKVATRHGNLAVGKVIRPALCRVEPVQTPWSVTR